MSGLTWETVLDTKVQSQRGNDFLELGGRLYSRERTYNGKKAWSEYYVCVKSSCKKRVVRYTPHNGEAPYVDLGHGAQAHHHASCVSDPQAILLLKARQAMDRVVVQSSADGGAGQATRDTYDHLGRLIHQNEGDRLSYQPIPSTTNLFALRKFV